MKSRLVKFRSRINHGISCGEIALPVVDERGSHPVVFAMEDEPLFTLLGRLRAVGGNANLFVRGKHRTRQVSFVDQHSTMWLDDTGDDTNRDERPGPTASVGTFLDYLEQRPNGVLVPAVNPIRPAVARDIREVEFA